MSKHSYKKRLKYVFLAFTCATAFAFSGIASACGNDNNPSDDDNDKTTSKEDTQLLKNGNFEFFNIPEKKKDGNEPVHLIKTPENWSHGGTSSSAMSGIISTSETAWDKMKADNLASTLDYINSLDSSSSSYLNDYVDYNGMKSTDILYKDQYNALRKDDDIKDDEQDKDEIKNRKDIIDNPGTHYNVTKKDDGSLYTNDGTDREVFVNDKGEYFLKYDEEKDEYSEPISNVLMLHNYASSHNGIAQNYSSVEIELPANTAAEISVWVKTSYLLFSQGNTVKQDRGANISVTQTVGNTSIDKFTISCINTEKLLGTGNYKDKEPVIKEDKYNGWIEYTVYVNACDFASSKIKLELGLGETNYTTEGYAFFDDVTVTKYSSLDKCKSYNEANENDIVTCNLSTDADDKVFKADSLLRNEGLVEEDKEVKDKRYSDKFKYLIDLASENIEYGANNKNTYTPVTFNTTSSSNSVIKVGNLKTGYTVDDDNYVSSNIKFNTDHLIGFKSVDDQTKNDRLPFKSPINTSDDLLAFVTTGYDFDGKTIYAEKLKKALDGAANLPKNNDTYEDNMLVMLSAYGTAYTTSFELSIPRNGKADGQEYYGYQIISFWVKTSDMEGSTAATVSVEQTGNDENRASFTLDTTGAKTNIGTGEGEEDIFDGWVQCFFFVKNELDATGNDKTDTITVNFSFGNTTIKGSDIRSYKNGWVALANMQVLNVNEKIFSYTGSGDHTASLTISEEAKKNAHVFDDAYGNEAHQIKNDMVIPSSYTGVNGGSSAIVNNGIVSIPFDEPSNNSYDDKKFTGLINKEHFEEYRDSNRWWYNDLLVNFTPNHTSNIEATKAWDEIFGSQSVQPLIITNMMKKIYIARKGATEENFDKYYIKDKETGEFRKADSIDGAKFDKDETYYTYEDVINYGYIGEEKQVSADGYATISVRVKVSRGAVAYVYLVDTSAGNNVLSFRAPSYSFYYDIDGNVLKDKPKSGDKKQPKENILYSLRDDGLYEDESGKLYANTWNYKKLYYENVTYYDEAGNEYNIDGLIDGVTYYNSANKETRKEANHYLVTSDGTKVYQFTDGAYHYIVDGKAQSKTVYPFDVAYARYDYSDKTTESGELIENKEDYMVEIVGSKHVDDNNVPQWVTVTFVLHAGSEAKSYRLELWSGKREETVTKTNSANENTSEMVIFDYSYVSSSNSDWKDECENAIIESYLDQLDDSAFENIETSEMNIRDVEKLATDNGVELDQTYKAHYYTYSLYDSADFKPFNKEVASDGATGYDYSVADQTETLVYLQVENAKEHSYTVFADYSAIDKSVTLNNPTDDKTDDNETETDNSADGSIWLLASSIILVIALIFAIIAIFLKDAIKKARRNKVTSKNNYDQRKTNRYKRKLHLKNEEIVEVDATEVPANAEAEEVTEEIEETHTEEAPVEEVVSEEPEAPATSEETEEAPAPAVEEETPAEEESSDNNSENE